MAMTTAAAASAHWLRNHGERTTAGAVTRARTERARLGVAGHSSSLPRAISCCSSSGTCRLLVPGPKARQGSRQAGFDGAFWDAECGRRLVAAQLEEIAARDHQPGLAAPSLAAGKKAAARAGRA